MRALPPSLHSSRCTPPSKELAFGSLAFHGGAADLTQSRLHAVATWSARSVLVLLAFAAALWTVLPGWGSSFLCAAPRVQRPSFWQGQRHSVLPRRAKVDGPFGVLQESDAPIIDLRDADELLSMLVAVVQMADSKRGIEISAFWVNNGYDIVVIITALSRPQLQAIGNAIADKMKKELKVKRNHGEKWMQSDIRSQAATGWCCLMYRRLTVHIMTPVQRSYYDIEGIWRDDNQDYEKIPVDEMLREDGFGNLRLTRELGTPRPSLDDEEAESMPLEEDAEQERDYGPYGEPRTEPMEYDKDEEDPFWS